jgi:hypothetical protein
MYKFQYSEPNKFGSPITRKRKVKLTDEQIQNALARAKEPDDAKFTDEPPTPRNRK